MLGRLPGVLFLPVVVGMIIGGAGRLAGALRSRGAARSAQLRSLAASAATGLAGIGAMAAWLALAGSPPEDIRLATLPALACSVAALTAAVSELTWPRPTGAVRVASLADRRTPAPVGLRRLVGVGFGATIAGLLVGGLTAAPDGRSFTRRTADFAATGSTYPGLSYGIAVGAATTVLALATWFAWARVDARPALGPAHQDLDAAVRGTSRVRVLRPAAVGSLSTAAGLWLTLGATVNGVTQNLRMNDTRHGPRPPLDWVQDLGFVAVGAGLVLGLLTLMALGWDRPRMPREERATAPGVAGVGA